MGSWRYWVGKDPAEDLSRDDYTREMMIKETYENLSDAAAAVDEYLDDIEDNVVVWGRSWRASEVLRAMDPEAYEAYTRTVVHLVWVYDYPESHEPDPFKTGDVVEMTPAQRVYVRIQGDLWKCSPLGYYASDATVRSWIQHGIGRVLVHNGKAVV